MQTSRRSLHTCGITIAVECCLSTTWGSAVKTVVPVSELRRGMFVSELDRPWIETPLPLQGFLIENDDQIAVLQRYCETVTVDRSRSLGAHYTARSWANEVDASGIPAAFFLQPEDALGDDFHGICRLLRLEPKSRRYAEMPTVRGFDSQSRLEPELLYSAPLVDDVKNTLHSIRENIGTDIGDSLKLAGNLVGEMARAIERNPDAMLWLARLRSADRYSYDHAVDVSVHLMVLGRFLDLPGEAVELLGLAGLMQDVGKVDIPTEILQKPGELTDEEYAQVQSHVASSLEILIGQPGFSVEALDIVASHHERLDGSGYPRRLKGERLSLYAEMAGLVDSYCAMTRQRPHQTAISAQKALEDLIRMRGTKFREVVVDQLIQCIGIYPIGTLVELNSGEVAIVIQQNQIRRLKPRVMVVLGPDKTVERRPRTLDLLMEPTIGTGETYRIVHALPNNAYGIDPAEFYLE